MVWRMLVSGLAPFGPLAYARGYLGHVERHSCPEFSPADNRTAFEPAIPPRTTEQRLSPEFSPAAAQGGVQARNFVSRRHRAVFRPGMVALRVSKGTTGRGSAEAGSSKS
jgi:hypothetical protein